MLGEWNILNFDVMYSKCLVSLMRFWVLPKGHGLLQKLLFLTYKRTFMSLSRWEGGELKVGRFEKKLKKKIFFFENF